MVNEDKKRELLQLWYIANHYYKNALKNCEEIPHNIRKIKLLNITNDCKFHSKFINYKNFMTICADLDSSAIRLYSIDEIFYYNTDIKNELLSFNKLYKLRLEIHKENKSSIRGMLNRCDKILHIMLRHCIAHMEDYLMRRYPENLNNRLAISKLNLDKIIYYLNFVIHNIEYDLEILKI